MACLADAVAMHRELGRCIESQPAVASVDYIPPGESPSGRPETEIVVRESARGTVPNSVAMKVVESSIGIAAVQPGNNPRYRRVIVR